MKALFLTSLLLYSCTEYATIDRSAIGLAVKGVEMEISQLKEETWLIGKRKEAEVSQGLTFLLDMPKLKEEDRKFLTREKGVDAWIVRIIQEKGTERLDLGSLYALFDPPKVSRGKSGGPSMHVGIRINYAASHHSMRFRRFSCPAFTHRKKITSMSVEGVDGPFEIVLGPPAPYKEKSQRVQLSPSAFNGGHILTGRFFVEIAPYSTKERSIIGSFQRIPQFIEVGEEETVEVPSCAGVHPEID